MLGSEDMKLIEISVMEMNLDSCDETMEENEEKGNESTRKSEEENERIEEFLKGIHFIDGCNVAGKSVTGHVSDERAFLNEIIKMGYSFKRYTKKIKKGRLRLLNNGILPQNTKCAFRSCSINYYACSHGASRHNPKKHNDHEYRKQRFRLHNTKKFDCAAKMQIQKLVYFPQYEMPLNYNTRSVQKVLEKLKNDKNPREIRIFKVQIDLPQIHNHSVETSLINQLTNPAIVREIRRLATCDKITNVKIMRNMLKEFVSREYGEVNPLSRAFFPKGKTLRNYIAKFNFERNLNENNDDDDENNDNNDEIKNIEKIREVCTSMIDKTYLISDMSFEKSNEVLEKLLEANEILSMHINKENGISLLPEDYLDLPKGKKRKLRNA